MSLPRDLVRTVRRLDEAQLRRLLILARGLLVSSEAPVMELDDIPGLPAVRYYQREVACGRTRCRTCPHGPYWYASWSEAGRKQTMYLGRDLPADVRRRLEELDRTPQPPRPVPSGHEGPSRD